MDNKQNSRAKALILKVHPPMIETKDVMYNFSGKIVTAGVLLVKSSTQQNIVASSSLCRDENLTSWHVPPSCLGEIFYMSGYWEWVEDVLAPQQGGFEPQQNL
ncbi:hypothetical protein KY284_001376 [Solanum tuberosum]|nr:hypothetical protein KY284_001376 [Solanum tuberosum]